MSNHVETQHMDPRGLLDRFEHEGYWWAPSRPDDRAPGTLSYDPTNGLHLELLGHMTLLEGLGGYDRAERAVIHGLTKTGRTVTLDGCFLVKFQYHRPGITTERFYSRTALAGAHIAEPETATFPSCAFRFSHLEEWLSAQPFSVTPVTTRPPYALDVGFRAPAETTHALEHPAALLRTTSSYQTQDEMPRHYGISARSWLVLEPDSPRPLAWYKDAVAKLRNLIALCFGAPVYIEGVTLLGADPSPGRDRLEANVVYLQSPSPPAGVPRPPERGLSLADFCEAGGDLSTWFKMYDVIEPALNLFFAVLFGRSLYMDVRFLLLAQAMETVHRSLHESLYVCPTRYKEIRARVEGAIPSDAPDKLRGRISGQLERANEYSFRDRLAELSSGPLTKMGVAKMNSRKRHKIVGTRNYYTHYSEDLKHAAARGREMHDLIGLMTAAMIAILFDMLGVAPERVREWMEKSREFKEFVR